MLDLVAVVAMLTAVIAVCCSWWCYCARILVVVVVVVVVGVGGGVGGGGGGGEGCSDGSGGGGGEGVTDGAFAVMTFSLIIPTADYTRLSWPCCARAVSRREASKLQREGPEDPGTKIRQVCSVAAVSCLVISV